MYRANDTNLENGFSEHLPSEDQVREERLEHLILDAAYENDVLVANIKLALATLIRPMNMMDAALRQERELSTSPVASERLMDTMDSQAKVAREIEKLARFATRRDDFEMKLMRHESRSRR